jgi:hypothetical protein
MKNFLKFPLFVLLVAFITLPACKTAEGTSGYFIEVAKTFTKKNLQVLFPDAHFDKDSVSVSKVFPQAQIRKILNLKFRNFLTEKGNIALDNLDFLASVSWEREAGDKVKISVLYKNKKIKTACLPIDMKDLYLAVATALDAIPAPDKIVLIDRWNNQFSRQDETHPLLTPCAFIELGNVAYSRNKQGIQTGKVTLRVYVGQSIYTDSYQNATDQATALKTFDLLEKVYTSLQDLSGEKFTKLERVSTDYDTQYTNLITDAMTFETTYTDTSKLEASNKIKIMPDLVPKRVGIDV